jgi:hypothetical protein
VAKQDEEESEQSEGKRSEASRQPRSSTRSDGPHRCSKHGQERNGPKRLWFQLEGGACEHRDRHEDHAARDHGGEDRRREAAGVKNPVERRSHLSLHSARRAERIAHEYEEQYSRENGGSSHRSSCDRVSRSRLRRMGARDER